MRGHTPALLEAFAEPRSRVGVVGLATTTYSAIDEPAMVIGCGGVRAVTVQEHGRPSRCFRPKAASSTTTRSTKAYPPERLVRRVAQGLPCPLQAMGLAFNRRFPC